MHGHRNLKNAESLFIKMDMFYTATMFPVVSEKRKVDMKREGK